MKRIFHVDNMEGKNRVSKGKERRYTEENDDLIPRDAHEFDEFADESLKSIESGDKVPFDGYDGGSDLAKKRRKSVEESDEYMTFEAHKFDAAEKLNAFEIGDKVSFEVYDGGHASEGKSEKYVDTDGIENEQAIEDSHRDRVDNNVVHFDIKRGTLEAILWYNEHELVVQLNIYNGNIISRVR
ncbi:uncharacterized protein [Primulina huaijiensis]|uniref:uncharacterized protein n=1 Tax=Primulina huaijiensis TaxID=1492673 RepID=UPI003CC767FB